VTNIREFVSKSGWVLCSLYAMFPSVTTSLDLTLSKVTFILSTYNSNISKLIVIALDRARRVTLYTIPDI